MSSLWQAKASSPLYKLDINDFQGSLEEVLSCPSSVMNFYSIYFKLTSPNPISFKLDASNIGTAPEFFLNPDSGQKMYAVYQAGNDCYYHQGPILEISST